ncbi:polysaccharide deacetylase family protein [Gordoniibacillus kamchatkensis]|uniref:polysaccharide deacetylase family protein n=1 Tax=Gordoniibacillus kamchatkensis TaxID=1590651 RepID=UPI000698DAEE|nr:polysaccharide deacetylase family protein [Paenibacillus sp. VKM B-2647]
MRAFAGRRWQWLLVAFFVLMVAAGVLHQRAVKLQDNSSPAAAVPAEPIKETAALGTDADPDPKLADPESGAQPAMQTIASPQAVTRQVQEQFQAANEPQKIYYRNKVAVLTYHHLDPKESSITITPERFKAHLETLRNHGFRVISVEDFVDFLQKKKPVPPNAVVITFDDGYESVYKYAYPLLKQENMTATVFLIVGYIEDSVSRLPPILTWAEIKQMHADGFSFYSHSYHSHESVIVKGKELSELVTKLVNPATKQIETESEYRARLLADFQKADDILNAQLGNKVNLLCLPHGQYNQAVVDVANQAGIPFLFTGTEGLNTDKDKLIKRINAGSPYMSDKLLIAKLSAGK